MSNTTSSTVTEALDVYLATWREGVAARTDLFHATARVADARDALDAAVQRLGEAIRADAGEDRDVTRLVDGGAAYTVRVTARGNPSSYDVTGGPAYAVRRA